MRVHRAPQVVEAATIERRCGDHGRSPGIAAGPQPDELPQVLGRQVSARQVGLVDTEHVGDLEQAGLEGLDLVAQVGNHDHHAGGGDLTDLDVHLPAADGLDDHDVHPEGVQEAADLPGRRCDAARMSPAGHGSEEDPVVPRTPFDPDPVPQNRAPGERTGRIDRHHPDLPALRPEAREEGIDQRGLSDPEGPRDPDRSGRARCVCRAPATRPLPRGPGSRRR